MKTVVLLGGNLGDSKKLFAEAILMLGKNGFTLLDQSKLYRSSAWGYESENSYLNQVILFDTEMNPQQLLEITLSVEKELGRIRKNEENYTDRPIDIDILYLDDLIVEEKELIIPHPRLHLRKFTLGPLVEILPDFIHPILKKDHKSLLLLCPDSNTVEVID